MSPGARTKRALQAEGWVGGSVELWIPGARIRRDWLGFADSLWIRFAETLAVQHTSGSNLAARLKKALENPALPAYLCPGSNRRFEVWGWRKLKGIGWVARVVPITLDPAGGLIALGSVERAGPVAKREKSKA